MQLELWQHQPTQDRYIVLTDAGAVRKAAGPLTGDQLQAVQRDEWAIPWAAGLERWVEARRGEFTRVW